MATSQEHDHEHEHEVRKSFDEHMTDIKSDVIRVAAMAGEMVGMATEALLDKELLLVERVVESNRRLDELNHDIEFRTYELFATQQPMAIDLRTLLTVLRTLHELELTGGLTVSVAKAARRIYPGELPPENPRLARADGGPGHRAAARRRGCLRRPRRNAARWLFPTWTT